MLANNTTEIPAVDNDWSGRWRIGRCRLGNKCQTRQRVNWNSMVWPVGVVVLIYNSLTDTLLASHQAAVTLLTT